MGSLGKGPAAGGLRAAGHICGPPGRTPPASTFLPLLCVCAHTYTYTRMHTPRVICDKSTNSWPQRVREGVKPRRPLVSRGEPQGASIRAVMTTITTLLQGAPVRVRRATGGQERSWPEPPSLRRPAKKCWGVRRECGVQGYEPYGYLTSCLAPLTHGRGRRPGRRKPTGHELSAGMEAPQEQGISFFFLIFIFNCC